MRWFFNEKAPQSFFDNRFLVRKLAVVDLLLKKPLKFFFDGDVNHGESSQSVGLRPAPCNPISYITSRDAVVAKWFRLRMATGQRDMHRNRIRLLAVSIRVHGGDRPRESSRVVNHGTGEGKND